MSPLTFSSRGELAGKRGSSSVTASTDTHLLKSAAKDISPVIVAKAVSVPTIHAVTRKKDFQFRECGDPCCPTFLSWLSLRACFKAAVSISFRAACSNFLVCLKFIDHLAALFRRAHLFFMAALIRAFPAALIVPACSRVSLCFQRSVYGLAVAGISRRQLR